MWLELHSLPVTLCGVEFMRTSDFAHANIGFGALRAKTSRNRLFLIQWFQDIFSPCGILSFFVCFFLIFAALDRSRFSSEALCCPFFVGAPWYPLGPKHMVLDFLSRFVFIKNLVLAVFRVII